MVRVLVTRPEPGAARTVRRLAYLGFQPVRLALTETMALPVEAGVFPAAVAVGVTSANAVRHAPMSLIKALAALPCHAVGRRTAEACRAAGFFSVDEGPGDAEALANALAGHLGGKDFVYLCGRVRFPGFETLLAAAGARVHAVETYDTVRLNPSDEEAVARLSNEPIEAALLYSAEAAAALSALVRRAALRHLFEKTEFLALSTRVAGALDGVIAQKVRIAARPDEEALLALLTRRR